jgi:UDP-glucose 4-epimerase
MITGAAGFIGSHLAERLLASNNTVVAYDNFDSFYTGKEGNLRKALESPYYKLHRADILDFDKLKDAMEGVNVVFHLAAQPGVRFSAVNPWKTNSTNVDGTLNVLLAAAKTKVERMIFASSSSVYGAPKIFPCPENLQPSPISVYGASKLSAENYCMMFSQSLGLPIVILRYHTVYGPRQRPDMAIHKFTKAMYEGNSPVIYGDGEQTRDFTYVLDVVDGTVLAAEKEESTGQTFNIGSGSSITVNELLKLLRHIMNKENLQPIYENKDSGDVEHTQADILKATQILKYDPKTNIKEGLRSFFEWYVTDLLKANSLDKAF